MKIAGTNIEIILSDKLPEDKIFIINKPRDCCPSETAVYNLLRELAND
ncbi:hypothetical protein LCGC14_0677190 [marine sediment metagenome]|uniref:Uncharacterized protein n=1 Tax=marine sediment metagenome TaxID=412755 RepID=A0A0F9QPA1_9ZZZZ